MPEGFELQIEKRLHERQNSKKPQEGEEKPAAFKAQRLPKKILEGVVVSLNPVKLVGLFPSERSKKRICSCQQGLPDKKVLHPTVPESPAFALKKRVRLEPKVEEVRTRLLGAVFTLFCD